MAYTKQAWTNDGPDTPITAERLDHIVNGKRVDPNGVPVKE